MAKKNIGTVSAISPIPAFMATCADKNGNSNIITISYGGIINAVPPMAYISVRDTRYSYHMLKETGEFVINLTTRKNDIQDRFEPSPSEMGFKWFVVYALILLIIHNLSLFLLEAFSLRLLGQTLLQVLLSVPVSLFMIMLVVYLFKPFKK